MTVQDVKRAWGPGPWHDEPDLVRFTHLGLDCCAVSTD